MPPPVKRDLAGVLQSLRNDVDSLMRRLSTGATVSEHWATKSGPTEYVSPYKVTWSKGAGAGGSFDATSNNQGIVILVSGIYEVSYRQRGSAAGGYAGLGLNGSREALQSREDAGGAMWAHDHFPAADSYGTSFYVGPLNAGELITAGPSDNSQNAQYGTAGYMGHIIIRRIS